MLQCRDEALIQTVADAVDGRDGVQFTVDITRSQHLSIVTAAVPMSEEEEGHQEQAVPLTVQAEIVTTPTDVVVSTGAESVGANPTTVTGTGNPTTGILQQVILQHVRNR